MERIASHSKDYPLVHRVKQRLNHRRHFKARSLLSSIELLTLAPGRISSTTTEEKFSQVKATRNGFICKDRILAFVKPKPASAREERPGLLPCILASAWDTTTSPRRRATVYCRCEALKSRIQQVKTACEDLNDLIARVGSDDLDDDVEDNRSPNCFNLPSENCAPSSSILRLR